MTVSLQKKISVAKVFGKINAVIVAKSENGILEIGRFFGSASGTKSGVSDFGEWTALTGQFRAINKSTGETFDSGVCFLPDVALDLIVGQLMGGARAVDFAFDINAVLDDTVQVGYSYRAIPILEATGDSPIARIESQLAKLAALPAPGKKSK